MGATEAQQLRTERLLLRPWTTSPGDLSRLSDIYQREVPGGRRPGPQSQPLGAQFLHGHCLPGGASPGHVSR